MAERILVLALFLVCTLGCAAEEEPLFDVRGVLEDLRREERVEEKPSCPNPGPSNVDLRMNRLETLMSIMLLRHDVGDVKEEQSALKGHLLNRLDAIEEKAEWCLTGSLQGARPLLTQLAQIKQSVADLKKDFRPSNRTIKIPTVHTDCQAAHNAGWNTSGIYTISPDGVIQMDVYCEQETSGGGWTVFQRRQDGSVDFYRNWADYKAGFGNLDGEFFLGNDNIRLLTKNRDQKLKIELRSPGGEFAYADYSTFWIDDESQKYKMHSAGYSGAVPPGNSLNNGRFSTKDQDNDDHKTSCANTYYGGWWYTACHSSNLNGLYGNTTYAKGLSWRTWTGYHLSMTSTKMMIKKKA